MKILYQLTFLLKYLENGISKKNIPQSHLNFEVYFYIIYPASNTTMTITGAGIFFDNKAAIVANKISELLKSILSLLKNNSAVAAIIPAETAVNPRSDILTAVIFLRSSQIGYTK